MLQQILRLLVAGVHRDELYLSQVYDDAVVTQDHVSGWSGPKQTSVTTAKSDAAR